MRKPKFGWETRCLHPTNVVPRVCPCVPDCGCRYYYCKVEAKKHESELKSKLLEKFRLLMPKYHQMSHEDVRTAGIPDWSVTGYGKTSWWEFKHATPDFESLGRQELNMLRLASGGFARYVIWHENADTSNKRTLIVHPRHIRDLESEDWCTGFDSNFILSFMRKVHQP